MTTTRNKIGKLLLCLLCAVAMIASSVTITAASTPATKAKTTKVKKSKKGKKTTKKSTKKTEKPVVEDDRAVGTTNCDEIEPVAKPMVREREAERTLPPKPLKEEVFISCDQMPQFPGGDAALIQFISSNIRYPQTAKDNGIQGKVVVQMVIEKDGKVGEVKVARGVDKDLDREAIRVCKCLPAFSPGRNSKGDPVRVWYTMPIQFKLQGVN